MASRRRVWAPSGRRERPAIPAGLKARVQAGADALVAEVIRPRLVQPLPEDPQFNYITDVFTR